jgi:hypothetical protein
MMNKLTFKVGQIPENVSFLARGLGVKVKGRVECNEQ